MANDQTRLKTEDRILRQWMPEEHREWLIVVPGSVGWIAGERLELDDLIPKLMHLSRSAYNRKWEFVFIVGPEHLRRHAEVKNPQIDDLIFPLNRVVNVSCLTLYQRPDGRMIALKQRYPAGSYPSWERFETA